MKRFIEGVDRSQSTLFPESLDDYVAEDNPVRVVDVFVDELDLLGLGFYRVAPRATGRPGYQPSMLLKLYIYGYLNRIQSSRRLEREAGRNVELMWLTGRLAPDHKTIADFRKDYGRAIRKVCVQFVVLCRRLDLFADACVAIDGSKFKAVNARDKNFTRAKMKRRMAHIEESAARYLRQLDSADRQEPSQARTTKTTRLRDKIATLKTEMQRHEQLEAEMLATPDQQISLSDPDARSMRTTGRDTGVVGYNVQAAVDAKHHLIVAHEVTNVGIDSAQLSHMAKRTKAALKTTKLDVVADRGYFSGKEILACAKAGVTVKVLAFATHGLVAGDFAGLSEPALVLTPPETGSEHDDGLLTASEVAQLKLDADWVILSACNTAAADGAPGAEGLSGLAKAFFYAGSRALLVSHWPVVSDAAVAITTRMLKEAAKPGVGRAEAHRRAMMALIDETEHQHFAHPMFWAPFVVVGEGGGDAAMMTYFRWKQNWRHALASLRLS